MRRVVTPMPATPSTEVGPIAPQGRKQTQAGGAHADAGCRARTVSGCDFA